MLETGELELAVLLVVVAAMVVLYLVTRVVARRRKARLAASLSLPTVKQNLPLREVAGAITAVEAMSAVAPVVAGYDSAAVLTAVSSGQHIGEDGRSPHWELAFHLPATRRTLTCSLHAGEPEVGGAKPPLFVTSYLRKQADGAAAGLPRKFIDSPQAMKAFADQGVDFLTGDMRFRLRSGLDEAGNPAWCATAYGKEHRTGFAMA